MYIHRERRMITHVILIHYILTLSNNDYINLDLFKIKKLFKS
jgi:hypothetical protein